VKKLFKTTVYKSSEIDVPRYLRITRKGGFMTKRPKPIKNVTGIINTAPILLTRTFQNHNSSKIELTNCYNKIVEICQLAMDQLSEEQDAGLTKAEEERLFVYFETFYFPSDTVQLRKKKYTEIFHEINAVFEYHISLLNDSAMESIDLFAEADCISV
jgi:hypothetical protein